MVSNYFNEFNKIFIQDGALLTLSKGFLTSLSITFFAIIFGTIIAFFITFLSLSKIKIVSAIANTWTAIIRGVPVLLLLLLMYYVIFAKTPFSAVTIAIITYSINVSAYLSKIFEQSILATDEGQIEAARALGLSKFQSFIYITLPQSFNIANPLIQSTIVNLIQWTSVVGYITITDLTRVINNFSARSTKPLLMIVVGMLIYLFIAYLIYGIFYLYKIIKKNKNKII